MSIAAKEIPVFPNVPKMLEEAVRRPPNFVGEQPTFRYLWAANCVAWFYIGKSMDPGRGASIFGLNPADFDNNSAIDIAHIQAIGTILFELRLCSGFSEFCRRLSERDLQSTFFELLAARLFYPFRFDLLARPEVGIRGEDFDFVAVRNSEELNVEVTSLTAPRFSNTIINALNHKRKQLPNTKPAIIICHFPAKWVSPDFDLGFALMHTAFRFLAGTRRINAVIFHTTQPRNLGDGASAIAIFQKIFANTTPRFSADLDFLYKGLSGTHWRASIRRFRRESGRSLIQEKPRLMGELLEKFPKGEFEQWVDSLFPMPHDTG